MQVHPDASQVALFRPEQLQVGPLQVYTTMFEAAAGFALKSNPAPEVMMVTANRLTSRPVRNCMFVSS